MGLLPKPNEELAYGDFIEHIDLLRIDSRQVQLLRHGSHHLLVTPQGVIA